MRPNDTHIRLKKTTKTKFQKIASLLGVSLVEALDQVADEKLAKLQKK